MATIRKESGGFRDMPPLAIEALSKASGCDPHDSASGPERLEKTVASAYGLKLVRKKAEHHKRTPKSEKSARAINQGSSRWPLSLASDLRPAIPNLAITRPSRTSWLTEVVG